jgi:hypothetical protein
MEMIYMKEPTKAERKAALEQEARNRHQSELNRLRDKVYSLELLMSQHNDSLALARNGVVFHEQQISKLRDRIAETKQLLLKA